MRVRDLYINTNFGFTSGYTPRQSGVFQMATIRRSIGCLYQDSRLLIWLPSLAIVLSSEKSINCPLCRTSTQKSTLQRGLKPFRFVWLANIIIISLMNTIINMYGLPMPKPHTLTTNGGFLWVCATYSIKRNIDIRLIQPSNNILHGSKCDREKSWFQFNANYKKN